MADQCRCRLCKTANSKHGTSRRRAIAMGRWVPYVDAQPAHDHLNRLRDNNIGIDRMVTLTGVPRSTVRRILKPYPNTEDRPRRIRPDIAARILAVHIDDEPPPSAQANTSNQPPVAGERQGAGHELAFIASRLRRTPGSHSRSRDGATVTVRTQPATATQHPELTTTTHS